MTALDTRARRKSFLAGGPWTESVLAAAITGMLTLIGVLVSNSRSRAVMEVKIEELTAKVEKHNQVLDRLYSVETKVAVLENDVTTLYKRTGKEE